MAEDYQSPEAPEDQGDDVGMEMDNPSDDQDTALLPLDFFQGRDLKPGSECRVKIRRLLKGQAEVEYVGDSEPDPGDENEPAEGEDEEMSGYMNQ